MEPSRQQHVVAVPPFDGQVLITGAVIGGNSGTYVIAVTKRII